MASKTAESLDITDPEYNERMKEQIENRLHKRDQSRLLEADRKRAVLEESKVTEEKSSFFSKHFKEELQNLHNMLQCQGFSPQDRSLLMEHFDAITVSYQRLQKFFNDSVMFLPRFQLRKAQGQLATLQELINEKRSEMLPKKKFAFKSKSKTNSTNSVNGKGSIPMQKESVLQKYENNLKQDCEVKGRVGETITLKNDQVNRRDVSLSHLNDCKVYIHGAPGTVHISNVDSCLFVIGPVSGSVFVETCTKSTIATGCQQLRVHHTQSTDFYLHVTSRAIIEDTTSVRFAPYPVTYPGIDEHYQISGLDRSVNNWMLVDDFNWLAVDKSSPNWQVVDIENRRNDW